MKSNVVQFQSVPAPLHITCGYKIMHSEGSGEKPTTKQIYDKVNDIYIPDFTATPAVLYPWIQINIPTTNEVYKSDVTEEDKANGVKTLTIDHVSGSDDILEIYNDKQWRITSNLPTKIYKTIPCAIYYVNPITNTLESSYLDITYSSTVKDTVQLNIKSLYPQNYIINPIKVSTYYVSIGTQLFEGDNPRNVSYDIERYDFENNNWGTTIPAGLIKYSVTSGENGCNYVIDMQNRSHERFRITPEVSSGAVLLSKEFDIMVKLPTLEKVQIKHIKGLIIKQGTTNEQTYKGEAIVIAGGTVVTNTETTPVKFSSLYTVTWHAVINGVDKTIGQGKTIEISYANLGITNDMINSNNTSIQIYVDVSENY